VLQLRLRKQELERLHKSTPADGNNITEKNLQNLQQAVGRNQLHEGENKIRVLKITVVTIEPILKYSSPSLENTT